MSKSYLQSEPAVVAHHLQKNVHMCIQLPTFGFLFFFFPFPSRHRPEYLLTLLDTLATYQSNKLHDFSGLQKNINR